MISCSELAEVLISERYRSTPQLHLDRVMRFLGLKETQQMSQADLEEQHVRPWYFEEPSRTFREQLREFYAQEAKEKNGKA